MEIVAQISQLQRCGTFLGFASYLLRRQYSFHGLTVCNEPKKEVNEFSH